MRHLGIVIKRAAQLREGCALDDRERVQQHPSLVEHREDVGGAGPRGNLVASDLHPRPLAGDTHIELHGGCILHHAFVAEVRKNAPNTCALLHLDPHRGLRRAGREVLLAQPGVADPRRAREQQHQSDQADAYRSSTSPRHGWGSRATAPGASAADV